MLSKYPPPDRDPAECDWRYWVRMSCVWEEAINRGVWVWPLEIHLEINPLSIPGF